jgi:hypothetical protein
VLADLLHHTTPVLSTAVLGIARGGAPRLGNSQADGKPSGWLAASGGTDGCVALWDLSAAATAAARAAHPAAQRHADGSPCPNVAMAAESTRPRQGGSGDASAAAPPSDGMPAAAASAAVKMPAAARQRTDSGAPEAMSPVAALRGVHQSGVNDVSLAPVPESWRADGAALEAMSAALGGAPVVLATAGDDQSLCVLLLSVAGGATDADRAPSVRPARGAPAGDGRGGAAGRAAQRELPVESDSCAASVAVAATARVPNAHSSALRAVWTDGRFVFSTGLDQRLRCWGVEFQLEGSLQTDRRAAAPLSTAQAAAQLAGAGPGSSAGFEAGDRVWWEPSAWGRAEATGGEWEAHHGGSRAVVTVAVSELACAITQVLEPAMLDVLAVSRDEYRIAVVGRGTQVLSFRCRERGYDFVE